MKNKPMFNTKGIIMVFLLICISAITIIITKPRRIPPKGNSTAYFDFFTYEGYDDYYSENPLPGEDYFYNPILPGWYSDPSICSNGEDYFLVASTFAYFPGIPIFHSKDLLNWKQIGNVLNRDTQLSNLIGQNTNNGIFAPTISYNASNKTYYLTTTNIGSGNFVVKTKDPFDLWSEPIYLPDIKGIDPSLFIDDNGKAYILSNEKPEGKPRYDGHRAIKIQEYDIEKDQTFGPQYVIVDGGVNPDQKPIWMSRPHIYKTNGKYYLIASEGGPSTNNAAVVYSSNSPTGPFKAWDKNPILTQHHLDPNRPYPITSTGNVDIIKAHEGDWWAFFVACRPLGNIFENLGRECFIMPVKWSDDGFPMITQNTEEIPMIVQRKGVKRNESTLSGNFVYTDNFDSDTLAPQWLTLRSSGKGLYSTTDFKGFLALKCSETKSTQKKTPSYVCRRIQHHKFVCSTNLYFNTTDSSESAGILIYKDERHQYFLSASIVEGKKTISLNKISRSGKEVLAKKSIESSNGIVGLKVKSNGATFDFYFNTKNKQWEKLIDNIDARYLSTSNSFGLTGTTIGLYAEKTIMRKINN